MRQEVVQIEAAATLELVGQIFGGLVVDVGLRLLDQCQDVAHPQNAVGHAVGMKRIQTVQLFADAHEFDRATCNRLD